MLFFLVSDVLFISQLLADFHSVSSSYTSTRTSFVKRFFNDVHALLYFMVLHAGERKDFQKCKANEITLQLISHVGKLACFNDSLQPNSQNNLKATFFSP